MAASRKRLLVAALALSTTSPSVVDGAIRATHRPPAAAAAAERRTDMVITEETFSPLGSDGIKISIPSWPEDEATKKEQEPNENEKKDEKKPEKKEKEKDDEDKEEEEGNFFISEEIFIPSDQAEDETKVVESEEGTTVITGEVTNEVVIGTMPVEELSKQDEEAGGDAGATFEFGETEETLGMESMEQESVECARCCQSFGVDPVDASRQEDDDEEEMFEEDEGEDEDVKEEFWMTEEIGSTGDGGEWTGPGWTTGVDLESVREEDGADANANANGDAPKPKPKPSGGSKPKPKPDGTKPPPPKPDGAKPKPPDHKHGVYGHTPGEKKPKPDGDKPKPKPDGDKPKPKPFGPGIGAGAESRQDEIGTSTGPKPAGPKSGGSGKGGKGPGRRARRVRGGSGSANVRKIRSADLDEEEKAVRPSAKNGGQRKMNHCMMCADASQTHCIVPGSSSSNQIFAAASTTTASCPSDMSNVELCLDASSNGSTGEIVADGYGTTYTVDGHTYESITDEATGACGIKEAGRNPTQIAFFAEIEYNFELISDDEIASHLEEEMGPAAICSALAAPQTEVEEIAGTGDGERRLRRHLQSTTGVVGFEPCGNSNYAKTTETCEPSSPGASACGMFRGDVCVYCAPGMATGECVEAGLRLLQDNASGVADPPRILGARVVGGSIGSAETGGNSDKTIAAISSDSVGVSGNDGASAIGIGLGVGLGVCALLVLLLAVRKNRRKEINNVSFLDDEDMYSECGDNDKTHLDPGDSSFDGTDIMSDGTGSPASWRKTRPGHIVGEDDSVFSGQKVSRNLVMVGVGQQSMSPADLARGGSGSDVHQCNSAMCEICNVCCCDPRFVPSSFNEMEADTSVNMSALSNSSRAYPMEDTIDL